MEIVFSSGAGTTPLGDHIDIFLLDVVILSLIQGLSSLLQALRGVKGHIQVSNFPKEVPCSGHRIQYDGASCIIRSFLPRVV